MLASGATVRPAQHAPLAIGHHPVKRARVGIEDERQEMAIAFPQRQRGDVFDGDPLERASGVALERCAAEARDDEQKAEPVLAALAESGPTDRAAQMEIEALDTRFLTDFD